MFSPGMGYTGGNHSGGFFPLAAAGAVPFGWVARSRPWGAAPRGPRLPGGGPHFSREMGRKRAGALPPWTLGFMAACCRSLVLGFVPHCPGRGLFRRPSSYPDLGTFFHKMLFQHIFPGNASQIGLRISEETAPSNGSGTTTAKTSEWERAAPNSGGEGPPPRLLRPGFLEKAWIPRPGPGGKPPRRCQPAPVQTRTTYQGQPGAAYPLVGASEAALGRSAPLPARPRAGARLSLKKVGGRTAGLRPGPGVYGRSFPLAGFGDGCLWPVRGSISSGILRPIWDAFLRNMLESIL